MPSIEARPAPHETDPRSPEKYERPITIETRKAPRVEIAMTTVGKQEPNEDAVLFEEKEQLAVVFDGIGGAARGDLASRLARDNFTFAYQQMKADILKMHPEGQSSLWQQVVEGNSNVDAIDLIQSAEDAQEEAADPEIRARNERRRSISKEIFERDAAAAQSHMGGAPHEVKQEAMAIYRALSELGTAIKQEAGRIPDAKGMGTTAAGVKMIETANGDQYGVFFGVGDSDAWVYRARTGTVERAVRTDNALEAMIQSGRIPKETGNDLTIPVVRRARYQGITQSLGSERDITPHVTVWKLEPGDRFLLNSDGLADNDTAENFKHTLGDKKLTEEKRVEQITKRAFDGITNKEGKGPDDITILSGEIKPPEIVQKWNTFVDKEISAAGLSITEAERIKETLFEMRGEIAQEARKTAEAHGETKDEIITELLRETLRVRIKELKES